MNKYGMMLAIISLLNVIYLIGFLFVILLINKIQKKINYLQEIIENSNDTRKVASYDNELNKSDLVEKQAKRENHKREIEDDVVSETKPRITIMAKSVYEPKQLDKPILFSGSLNSEIQSDISAYLIFNKYSIEKLKTDLDWGKKSDRNQVEQGGILLGNIALYKSEIYCFVEEVLLAKTKGMPAFVEFTSDMWNDMQSELAALNEGRSQSNKLIIVGWFHTHPNNLGVFMSGTDMKTQRLNFPLEWQVSLVMNPHKNIYRAFFGKNADEGQIIFLNE